VPISPEAPEMRMRAGPLVRAGCATADSSHPDDGRGCAVTV
jgi:hypothetical protein